MISEGIPKPCGNHRQVDAQQSVVEQFEIGFALKADGNRVSRQFIFKGGKSVNPQLQHAVWHPFIPVFVRRIKKSIASGHPQVRTGAPDKSQGYIVEDHCRAVLLDNEGQHSPVILGNEHQFAADVSVEHTPVGEAASGAQPDAH